MKYLANFADEIAGKQYKPGDEVATKGLEEGELQHLVRNGRLTVLEDGDPEVTAVGDAGEDSTKAGRAKK